MSNRSTLGKMRQMGGRGRGDGSARLVTFVSIRSSFSFFRLNVNQYTALRYHGLISEPLLNYLVRWKWLHIRPITGIKLFGYSKYTITCSKT